MTMKLIIIIAILFMPEIHSYTTYDFFSQPVVSDQFQAALPNDDTNGNAFNVAVQRISEKTDDDKEDLKAMEIVPFTLDIETGFRSCCSIYFRSDNVQKCENSFNEKLRENKFFKHLTLYFQSTDVKINLPDLYNTIKSGYNLMNPVDPEEGEPSKDIIKPKDISVIDKIKREYESIKSNFEQVCRSHSKFYNDNKNFINAEQYGKIMGLTIYFYLSQFDKFTSEVFTKVRTSDDLDCLLFYSGKIWSWHLLENSFSQMIKDWNSYKYTVCDTDFKTFVNRIRNQYEKLEGAYPGCSMKQYDELYREYKAKQYKDFGETYTETINFCINNKHTVVIDDFQMEVSNSTSNGDEDEFSKADVLQSLQDFEIK